MKKTIRLALALLLVVASLLSLAACGEKAPADASAAPNASVAPDAPSAAPAVPAKEYVIYSDNAFAPFEFLDTATNTYIGVDMDLLAAIAVDQGFTYTIHNEGFDAAMGAVQSGQADGMIAGMTIKDSRKETFDFSDGYFADGQILVVPSGSAIASLDDLSGKVVAVKTSTAGADYALEISGQYGFTLQYYEDSPTMYTAVINGTNEACFEDFSVVGWAIVEDGLALQTVGDVINPGYYGFAVKKGTNPELITLFNAGLANIKSSGQYDTILAKYGY
ncbi:MAG: transporter substrate-binding domain-containing protein [Oscillospiraceae bacterium]|jgi:polar amino acid transport system substrate-binding protein|nr:transporter substrate-binding domain-containing protein [Oscillospiraceae bacterium]